MVLGICCGVLTGIAVLAFLSRREQGELFQRMGLYLYKLCCVYKLPFVEGTQVSMDLERLHPGSSNREMQMDYYVEKLKLFLIVLLAGSGLTLMLCLRIIMEGDLGKEAVIERGEVGAGSRDLYLQASVAGEREEVYVNVLERQLREEELEGIIQVVDAWGTFEQNEEPSYDILCEKKNCLYKHVLESEIIELM